MKEQLISFETAKFAKEKGCTNSQGLSPLAFDFTQSLLQKWLREVHEVELFVIKSDKGYTPIDNSAGLSLNGLALVLEMLPWKTFDTHEEALEFGLIDSLEKI